MIRITSKQHLFRRAGVAHPKGSSEYPPDKFSAEELAALKAEPMLKVVVHGEAKKKTGEEKPAAAPAEEPKAVETKTATKPEAKTAKAKAKGKGK